MALTAPFPWFGGKSRVSHIVWERFGDIPNYVEPFFGSGAVLLGRPHPPKTETVNDIDGFVCNAWRSIAHSPDETVRWADQPAFENDLHARHVWLKARREILVSQLEGDPDYHDPKIAGWWLWGVSQWIGSGFCGDSGSGPWSVSDGRLVNNGGQGVSRQMPHLGNAGKGVAKNTGLHEWFVALSARMKRVRVCCGDWERICGPSVTTKRGVTGVFLDPPYSSDSGRCGDLYAMDCLAVANRVREWCIEHGKDPLLRIALCGYEGEHDELESLGWACVPWKAAGGFSNQGAKGDNGNKYRERIWFSPRCNHQHSLF